MKYILITGANSYIGTSLERYLALWPQEYTVSTIDMQGDDWKSSNLFGYDTVFHVAGIAHIKETDHNKGLYYSVNRDLTIDVAKKAKLEGVRQFIFLSSMSVYGIEVGMISENTIPAPKSHYGRSKLQAEEGLMALKDSNFTVSILRPPMVYGYGCKGNYRSLSFFAKLFPFFPIVNNQRSTIYINNLCEFVRLIVDDQKAGLFFPQNSEYTCTSDFVKAIANVNNKRMILVSGLDWILKIFISRLSIFRKVFGSLTYIMSMSRYSREYCITGFLDSVKESEGF